MSSRRRRKQQRIFLGFILLIVAFGIGSTIGISMGFNSGDDNVVQNNTTHVSVDVTHNISAYENHSDDTNENLNASTSNEGVVDYQSHNSSDSYYQTTDVNGSQYY
ncbi:hypothetical protein [uncultured Methanobrevibacter sp.]|uniref:hypothetical protein n=1 Tax=uncultured Methanobrevibacter sp. TaxID=253161 RepID=UPI002583AB48|nr:hypothetical protein [uncultured Methanobrevibacter sp.]